MDTTRGRLLAWALLLSATLALYGRALEFPFLLDDDYHLVRNGTVQSASGLVDAWTTNYWEGYGQGGLYRPLLKVLWTLELLLASALGLAPHAVVLVAGALLHATNGSLLVVLARRAGAPPLLALCAAAFFVLHAAHTEVLLTGVGQGESGSLALVLGALVLAGSARASSATRLGAVALALAAVLVKEQGLALLPATALALAVGPAALRAGTTADADGGEGERRGRLRALALLGAGAVGLVALRVAVLGAFGPSGEYTVAPHLTALERARLVPWLAGRYVALACLPLSLSPDHSWLQQDFPPGPGDPLVWLGAATLAGAALGLGLAVRARAWRAALALLLVGLPLAPVLGLLPIGSVFAERHVYHAVAGVALLVVHALAGRSPSPSPDPGAPRLRLGAVALLLVALACGARAARQVPRWSSAEELWTRTIEDEPRSWFAAATLANLYRNRQDWPRTRQWAEHALRRNPGCHAAALELGHVELTAGDAEAALEHYRFAATSPLYGFDARLSEVLALGRLGRLGEARALHAELAAERPGHPWVRSLAVELERAAAE